MGKSKKLKKEEPEEVKRNEVLQALSKAWALYVKYFGGRNYDRFLHGIQEAQIAVFEEEGKEDA